jgi:PAS domain S-box-containing protein
MVTERPAMESKLGRIVDALPGLVWTAFPDGQIDFLSQRWFDVTGLGVDECRDWGWQTAVHPEDLPRLLADWRTDSAPGAPVETEARLRGANGKYRWFLFRAHPSVDASGRVVKWCGLSTDIGERKQAEEALREDLKTAQALVAGEKRLLEMIARGRPIAHVLETLCRIVESTASGSYCSITLLDPSGAKLQEAIAPSIAPEFNESARGWPLNRLGGPCVMAARDKIQVVMSDVASDNRWPNTWRALAQTHGLRSCWSTPIVSLAETVLGTFALYQREPGSPNPLQLELIAQFTHFASIAIDAALRQSEARRAAAERELQLTIDRIPALVVTYRPDGSRTFVNQTWRDYTGLSLEDSERTSVVHPDDAARVAQDWRTSLAAGAPIKTEARLRRADGGYRWHLVERVAARDESGAIIKWYAVGTDIEERKRAEEALRQSEARLSEAERELRLMLDSIPVITWRGAANGYVQQLNKRWFEYTGTTSEQVRGRGWKSCVHPDDLEPLVDAGSKYVAAGVPIDTEARLRRFDGEYRWFLFRPAPARDEAGNIVAWYGTIIDIEDRKRAEEKAIEAERELQLIVDTIPAPVARYGRDGSPDFANQALLTYTGLTHKSLHGQRWTVPVAHHPDDVPRIEAAWRTHLPTGQPFDLELRLRRADGMYRWFATRRVPLRDANGEVIRWYAAGYDIEDRKRAEDELRRSEAFLAQAQRLTLTGSLWWNASTGEIIWSDESYRLMEYPKSIRPTLELILNRCHPEDRALVLETIDRSAREGTNIDFEHRLLMPDGRVKHVHVVVQNVAYEFGKNEFVGALTDITERKQAEEKLRRSEAFLAKAQRLSLTGSFSLHLATKEFTWSEELYRIFGFEPGIRVPLKLLVSRYHPEDRHVVEEAAARVRGGAPDFDYEHRLLMPDGSIKHIHVVGQGAPDKDGRGLEYFGAVQDITQRRVAEAALDKARTELAHVTRVMSFGVLTASIAHEVNQPLSGIITNASTCLRMLTADPPNIKGALETARRTIRDGNRAADVITRLRALFSKKAAATETVDLNEATREVLSLAHRDLLRNRVFLRTELDDDHPLLVTGDRVQLQQVILNLVRNASDAMRDVNDRPRHLLVKAERDEEGAARLIVKDAGVGLDPQSAERLFDAFYTNKEDGMGIGLSVSRSIIESHGGKLWAEANDGPGAAFSFSLPRCAESVKGERTGDAVLAPDIRAIMT